MQHFTTTKECCKAIAAEVSSHFEQTPLAEALSCQLTQLPLLSQRYILEYYLPTKHSATQGLHKYISLALSELAQSSEEHHKPSPLLIFDIVLRLVRCLRHLPPGLLDDEEAVDERLQRIISLLEQLQADHNGSRHRWKQVAEAYITLVDYFRTPSIREVIASQFQLTITKSSPLPSDQDAPSPPAVAVDQQKPELDLQRLALYTQRTHRPACVSDSTASGAWQIHISNRAYSQLRQLDGSIIHIVDNKLEQLSNGHFSGDNMKLLKSTADIPIFEAKCTRDLRIVYQIDLHNNAEQGVQWQILKIWGIVPHAAMDTSRLWKAISNGYCGIRSKEYKRRIQARSQCRKVRGSTVVDIIDPLSFPLLHEPLEKPFEITMPDLLEKDWAELNELLAHQKWMPYTRTLVNAAIAKLENTAHAFLLSEQEQRVVNETSSCFVLGRSGTGKTSCALYRLMGMEESSSMRNEPLRQMFVTKSPMLARRIREYYHEMCRGRDVPDIVSQNASSEAADLASGSSQNTQRVLKRLPARWSDLDSGHFPLFVSFDQLCSLLEADLDELSSAKSNVLAIHNRPRIDEEQDPLDALGSLPFSLRFQAIDANEDVLQDDTTTRARFSELLRVDMATFLKHYWPHFDDKLTKNVDASLCFSEFVGVIQGSDKVLSYAQGYLPREVYINLSARSQSTFSYARERIYELFLAYRVMKARRREWDAADRSIAILRAFQSGRDVNRVDQLYVDECQDHLLLDVLLLRKLVLDPRGHFWAGDTAQTISASTFRFQELSATFYQAEQSEPLVLIGARAPVQPRHYNLSVNYRSHAGITEVAATLVECVTQLFPNAIDTLTREIGLVKGQKPVIFDGYAEADVPTFRSSLFMQDNKAMEFGAEQCIIVRDSKTRKEVQQMLGNHFAIVLTVYDSKGLEFSDVLLWGFFDGSAATESQWRILLNMCHNDQKHAAPAFDTSRHGFLLNELRQLYVAVTRARNRLWIFDVSTRADPFKLLMQDKALVTLHRPFDQPLKMAAGSTGEAWLAKGISFFTAGNWRTAYDCFEKSEDIDWRNRALARLQEEEANRAFKARLAKQVVQREFEKAGDLLLRVARTSEPDSAVDYYRSAAAAYREAGRPLKQAACHESLEEWTIACRLYRTSKAFQDTLRLLQGHGPQEMSWLATRNIHGDHGTIEIREAQDALKATRLHFLKAERVNKSTQLFQSEEDQAEWADDYGDDSSRLEVLKHLGRHEARAYLLLNKGLLQEAADAFTQAGEKENALYYLRLQLAREAPLNRSLNDFHTNNVEELTQCLRKHLDARAALGQSSDFICSAFQCAAIEKTGSEVVHGQLSHADDPTINHGLRILVLDLLLHIPVDVVDMSHAVRQEYLAILTDYAGLLKSVCLRSAWPDGLTEALGFRHPSKQSASDNKWQFDIHRVIIPKTSPFYSDFRFKPTGESIEEGILAHLEDLAVPVSLYFSLRLFGLMESVYNTVDTQTWVWPPCFRYMHTGDCPKKKKCDRDHVTSDHLQHVRDRAVFWCSLLPLSRNLRWLALRLSLHMEEYQACRRHGRTVLDALVASGALHDLLKYPTLQDVLHLDLIYDEANDALLDIPKHLRADLFIQQMLGYACLAAFCSPSRFMRDFPHTRAIRRRSEPFVINIQPAKCYEHCTWGEGLFLFLQAVNCHGRVGTWSMMYGMRLLQAMLQSHLPMHMNGVLHIIDILALGVILSGRRAQAKNGGFDLLVLPEALAHQAVFKFRSSSFEQYIYVTHGLIDFLVKVCIALLNNDRRYRIDGESLRSVARPLMAARLLQLIACIGYNAGSHAQGYVIREKITQNVATILPQLIRNDIPVASSTLVEPKSEDDPSMEKQTTHYLHRSVKWYLSARTWSDIRDAFLGSGPGLGGPDRLIQLHLDDSRNIPDSKAIAPICATSLEKLDATWYGFRRDKDNSHQVDTTGATVADSSLAPRVPASSKEVRTSMPPREPPQISPNITESSPVVVKHKVYGVAEGRAVSVIQRAWRWMKARRDSSFKASLKVLTGYKLRMVQIARKLPHAQRFYRYALVVHVGHVFVALGDLIEESNWVKNKLARDYNSNPPKIESEEYLGRIDCLVSCRKEVVKIRKALEKTIPSGDLDLLRNTLKPLTGVALRLQAVPSDTDRADRWMIINESLQTGLLPFEGGPPMPPASKKSKRPALIDDATDVYAVDGYIEDEEEVY